MDYLKENEITWVPGLKNLGLSFEEARQIWNSRHIGNSGKFEDYLKVGRFVVIPHHPSMPEEHVWFTYKTKLYRLDSQGDNEVVFSVFEDLLDGSQVSLVEQGKNCFEHYSSESGKILGGSMIPLKISNSTNYRHISLEAIGNTVMLAFVSLEPNP